MTIEPLSALATTPLRSSNLFRTGAILDAVPFFTDSLLYGDTYDDFFLPRIAFVSGDLPLSSVQFDS